jgi:L,D-peptidoglycan transpeptidase YkuD (ErfK/YbiS/YcfS/YnhG family)
MNRRALLRATLAGAVAPVVAGAALPATAAEAATLGSIGTNGTGTNRWGAAVQPVNIAARLTTLPPETTQVIVVYGPDYTTTSVTLQTYQKVDGVWRFVNVALPARIGSKGFSDNHAEGVATTPTGVYSIGGTMYGIAADPGVRYPYHPLVTNDWWNENSASPGYNTFQHTSVNPGGYSEALWQITPAYTHFAVITYNMPPNVPAPIPDAGSGIFLHQHSATAGPTAGCVSLAHDHLVSVLTWLDPAASPRIVLAPYANLSRY